MLDHLRHVGRAVLDNRRNMLRPSIVLGLVAALYRNELAFLRRTSRLSRLLEVDTATVNALLRESQDAMAYCVGKARRDLGLHAGFISPSYGPVLYAAVRVLRPTVMVETGVASGVSSTLVLSAMERNEVGQLYSIDLPLPEPRLLPPGRETGWMVPERLRDRWELVLGDVKTELPPLLERLGPLDCFYHDSEHTFENMTWEFSQAYPRIRPAGLLMSDDITSNSAWDSFTQPLDAPRTSINRLGILRKSSG
jgi:hypothetical protein